MQLRRENSGKDKGPKGMVTDTNKGRSTIGAEELTREEYSSVTASAASEGEHNIRKQAKVISHRLRN